MRALLSSRGWLACLTAVLALAIVSPHAHAHAHAHAHVQAAAKSAAASPSSSPFVVAGYLPEWRFEGADWTRLAQTLTHLILFSLEPTPEGGIIGLKAREGRLPRPLLMEKARAATQAHGCKLLLCFGGNGRSAGFQQMVRTRATRKTFIKGLMRLSKRYQLDGVDYNWEYPGYSFAAGYKDSVVLDADYEGLALLVQETREAFDKAARKQAEREELGESEKKVVPSIISLAYYPDGRQEQYLIKHLTALEGGFELLDHMHIMSYDQGDKHHSSLEFGRQMADLALQRKMPADKVTLGLPFYGRNVQTRDWLTYEDIVRDYSLHRQQELERDGNSNSNSNSNSDNADGDGMNLDPAWDYVWRLPMKGQTDTELFHSPLYMNNGKLNTKKGRAKAKARAAGTGTDATGVDVYTHERMEQQEKHLQRLIAFNGVSSIKEKVAHAQQAGLAGVMIWEVGQDCRVHAVDHTDGDARDPRNTVVHGVTCPGGDDKYSLLTAIQSAIVHSSSAGGELASEGVAEHDEL